MLDGAVARLTGTQSDFGMAFDSISDAITFGLVPPIIVLQSVHSTQAIDYSFFLTTSAIIYSLCGALRLVRFNVTTVPPSEQEENTSVKKKNFIGLPIPAGACASVSLCLFLFSPEARRFLTISVETQTWILIGAQTIIGYLMISRWRFPSLNSLSVRFKSFNIVFILAILGVLILYGIYKHFAVVFFLITWLYIFIAWTLSLIRLIIGKRIPKLNDFEPITEDIEIK